MRAHGFVSLLVLVALVPACRKAAIDSETLFGRGQHGPTPVRVEGWRDLLSRPLDKKLIAVPADLVHVIDDDNRSAGFADHPSPMALDVATRRQFSDALSGLPPRLRALVNQRLIGVCPVTHLGSSAFTKTLHDDHGAFVGFVISVDFALINRPANEWMTKKERSPFQNASLDAVIEEASGDVPANALQYLLLHELGHLLALSTGSLPEWHTKQPGEVALLPFASLGWTAQADQLVAKEAALFPEGRAPRYYASPDAARPGSTAAAYYDALMQSGFPTLYSATNVDDDFADSFASYVHTVVLKRPWRVVIHQAGSPDRIAESCWASPRCAGRRRFFDQLLAQ